MTDLNFANDTCLPSNEIEQVQHFMAVQVKSEYRRVGLELNVMKIEIMFISIPAYGSLYNH